MTIPTTGFRVARPTNSLEAICEFYCDALGLKKLGEFRDHAGYDGVMIGIPGRDYHLEFTTLVGEGSCSAPSRDHLLVFYLPDRASLDEIEARLRKHGHRPVAPANPYWEDKSVTFEDPDGWRVVLAVEKV